MVKIALRVPLAEGSNWTVNVVAPPGPATVAAGCEVTVKSAAFAPET